MHHTDMQNQGMTRRLVAGDHNLVLDHVARLIVNADHSVAFCIFDLAQIIIEGNEGNEAIFWNGTIFVCFVALPKKLLRNCAS